VTTMLTCILAVLLFAACADTPPDSVSGNAAGPFISPAVPVRLGKIPPGAEIVFHQSGFI